MTEDSTLTQNLKELIQQSAYSKKVEKGKYLFREGTTATEIYYVESGMIQLNKINPDGRELTLKICSSGELICESTLFNPSTKYGVDGKVIEDTIVTVLLKDTLEKELSNNHTLALEFIKWMNWQQKKTQAKFRDLVLHGKKGALYSTLIRLSNSYGVTSQNGIKINIPLTNQELANFCGTSREVVNRLLSELRKNQIISINRGSIIIHNLELLKLEINCENCPVEICRVD